MTTAELVAVSRAAQGLPARVEDPATVRRIATILAAEPARRPTKEARRASDEAPIA